LERAGVTRDDEQGPVYSAAENEVDGRAFLARSREDRHQFRFGRALNGMIERRQQVESIDALLRGPVGSEFMTPGPVASFYPTCSILRSLTNPMRPPQSR
jgi:hypothetical protein